ncbi:hypothetical protein [Flavobacterium sp. N2038]|uniref:hypothetical protein n=1 Tax=Flavobacterium sp. N2038 TaxID=2986829 RepID=UPI002225A655|nr:hypothetical protein [Flavobacterium sp. N2038]
MDTNHNRIKVADLETNQQNKILTTNSSGELEFSDINNILVNDLTTGGTTKALTAEMGKSLESTKENVSSKVQEIEVNKTSSLLFPSVKAVYDWVLSKFQATLISGTNIKTINGASLLGSGDIVTVSSEPSQIVITTTTNITTETLDAKGKGQLGKNVIINNGTNAINITVNGGTDFCASYLKHGTSAITFVQGNGRSLVLVNGSAVLNGTQGSTATISSIGTTDYLRISN